MDAPNRTSRTPSPQPSPPSSSPRSSSSPAGSPGIPRSNAKNLTRFHKVKLNDAGVSDHKGISADRIKEVKDTINQKTDKTLFDLYGIWNTHNIVENKHKKLMKENKKDPEIPSLKQNLEKTTKELKVLNEINNIQSDLLLIDMARFSVNSDNKEAVEAFCRALLMRMNASSAKALISLINEKEVHLATEYRTINRDSSNMAQFFLTAYQEGNLSRIAKVETKFSENDKPDEAALKFLKKWVKGLKDNEMLKHLYSDLHEKIERRFPGKGDEMVLSLIVLRYLGPSLLARQEGMDIIPKINIQISKVLQSFISKESPKDIQLNKEFMDKGYLILKDILPVFISKP